MSKSNPKLLITGASGFVGAHLMQAQFSGEKLGTYLSSTPHENSNSYFQLDIQNAAACRRLIEKYQPDFLIHCAAKSNLDWCEKNKPESWRVNAAAPVQLAEICAENGVRFMFLSSDMVFDGQGGNYTEVDDCAPTSVYGQAKRHAEKAILKINPAFIIVRIALVFGLPVNGCGRSFLQWILQRIDNRQSVPLFIDQFRTPISVQELAIILLDLVQTEIGGIIHVAGPERLDRFQFGKYVCDAFTADRSLLQACRLAQLPQSPPRPADLSLNIDRLKSIISFTPKDCLTNLKYWATQDKNDLSC